MNPSSRFVIPSSFLILFGVLTAIFLVPFPARAITEADCPWYKYFYAECVGLRSFRASQPSRPAPKSSTDDFLLGQYPLFSRVHTNKDIQDMCASYFGKGTLAEAECSGDFAYKGIILFQKWTATDALMACSNLSGAANRTCVENEFQKQADELREDKGSDAEDTVIPTPLSEKAAMVSYDDGADASLRVNPKFDRDGGDDNGGALFVENENIITEPLPNAYAQRTIDSFLGMPARKASEPALYGDATSYSNWNIREESAAEQETLKGSASAQMETTFLGGLFRSLGRQEGVLSIPLPTDDRWGQPQAAAGGWDWGPLAGLVDKLRGENEPVRAYEPLDLNRAGSDWDASFESDLTPVYIEQAVPAETVETEQNDYSDYY